MNRASARLILAAAVAGLALGAALLLTITQRPDAHAPTAPALTDLGDLVPLPETTASVQVSIGAPAAPALPDASSMTTGTALVASEPAPTLDFPYASEDLARPSRSSQAPIFSEK